MEREREREREREDCISQQYFFFHRILPKIEGNAFERVQISSSSFRYAPNRARFLEPIFRSFLSASLPLFFLFFSRRHHNVPAFSVEQTIPPEVKSSIVERRTVNATAAKARYERVPRDSLPEQCTRKPVTVISSRGLRAKEHTREVAAIKVTGSAIVEHGNRSTRRRRV